MHEDPSQLIETLCRGNPKKFNGIIDGIRFGMNLARIESAYAVMSVFKASGLCDTGYLFLKMRQIYFMSFHRQHKMSRYFYQQI